MLIRHDDGWKNVSYIWNKDQTDAYKSIAGKTISTQFINEYGDMQDIRYRVPNINQCKECHQSNETISPIGPKARNLNKDISYADGSMNQLLKWHQQGGFHCFGAIFDRQYECLLWQLCFPLFDSLVKRLLENIL